MRLTEDVYLVGGSPDNGFGLSGGMDSHVYAIDGGDQIALVDCGMASDGSIDRIAGTMRADGLDPDRLSRIFVTHYHVDHCGGLAAWQDRFGVTAAADASVAPAIERADQDANGFALAVRAGAYPPDYELRPAAVADPLEHGAVRSVGRLTVRQVPTPGHCTGHSAYQVDGRSSVSLFSGDCVFHGGEVLVLNTADSDLAAYRESIFRLDALEFDALFPGHGALALTRGTTHVARAAAAFRTLNLPKNFI